MKELNAYFFRFIYLILIAFIFDMIFSGLSLVSFLNLIENILFSLLIILPIYFIINQKIIKLYYFFTLALFSLCLLFETIYYYIFKTLFSSSAIFISLDSNKEETKEIIDFYLDFPISVIAFILLLLTFVFLIKPIKNKIYLFEKSRKVKYKVASIILIILVFLKFSTLIVYNLPYLIVKSIIEYRIESNKLGDYRVNITGNFTDIKRLDGNDDELYVVIIGESTSRSHMGVYNYYRQTTPELNNLKNELLIYNDVISPHAYSIGALTKILTLGNYEKPEKVASGSIIQLANSVGFETFWLSNQRPVGPYESMITKISLSSKNNKFLTTTIAGNSKVLDEKLLIEFDKALKTESHKKVVFLHLMGTHHHYENRYPINFKKFNDAPKTKFKSKESTVKINHYDNAILYNDYIISKVIKKVDSINFKSFVIYFSDHGEEMFDDINLSGHNEDVYSKKMFEIPFIFWQSDLYKQENVIDVNLNRKYMIDDLFHSIADLLKIQANEVEINRSIFNSNFKERKRLIKDSLNFDTYFK